MYSSLPIIELLLLGVACGFLAGLLGLGGGLLMVPFMTMILSARGVAPDLSIKMAIATSMATIVFTSLSNLYAQHRRGAVRWAWVRGLAPGIVLGGLVASIGVFSWLKGWVLAVLFAAFVSVSATQMLMGQKSQPTRQMPGCVGLASVGSLIGFFSGLVGIGGGSLSVPFMIWCNVSIHNAVATSAALGLFIALSNVFGLVLIGPHIQALPAGSYGYIYLPALALVAATSVLIAPLGVRASHALPTASLKRVFAVLLYVLAGYMLMRAF